jgi:hypothetical protein
MKKGSRIVYWLVGVATFSAPAVLLAAQCFAPRASPADDVEDGNPCFGCTGAGAKYTSCPGKDVCVLMSAGWTNCVANGTLVAKCSDFSDAAPAKTDGKGCCHGGAYIGPSATTVTITLLREGPTTCN